jgi:beta-galactosidase
MTNRREFLCSTAATPLLPFLASSASNPADPLLGKVRLGAEFFLNTTETRESVFGHFRAMRETGLTIARIFTLWDQIEREQGKWDFTRYDWIYDAAAENGIQIANTLCSEDPPGWMDLAPFYHAWRDLANPLLRPHSEIYLEKVVKRYKSHPAHGVWLLQNEPGINDSVEAYVLEEYAHWLEQKYGTVENLGRVWYTRLKRFADVKPPADPQHGGWADYPSNLDWLRFRGDHLANQLRWIHAQIDKYHPGALTHINPPGLTGNMPASGRDMWKLKPTAHFMGTSMHAAWHFTMFPREDFGVAYGYCCDIVRSVSAPAPWWVTEMQAGPTVFTGRRPLNPTGGEITRWLWDSIGNGARGMVFWLWHPRTEGNEAGEWALAGPGGEPTARTRATQAVASVLRKHEDFFPAAKPLAAKTAILYDRDAMILYAVDGWRRPANEIIDSLMGCYKALHRAHVPVDFLDTSELEAGKAAGYKVLYLPYCYALSLKSAGAIREFVRNGGTVWADGLVAWKDEQGTTKQFPPGPLSDVFGFTVEDIDAAWDPFALSDRDDKAGELWRCLIPPGKGKVLLTGADGRPNAVEHSFGHGRAIYYASALTYAYLHRETPQMTEWIAAPAVEASRDLAVRFVQGPDKLSFRALEAQGRSAAVLNNWGAAGRATVHFSETVQSVVELLSGGTPAVRRSAAGVEADIELAAGASAVLLAT